MITFVNRYNMDKQRQVDSILNMNIDTTIQEKIEHKWRNPIMNYNNKVNDSNFS